MVTEDYVSFETAKFLKARGFMDDVIKFFASGYNSKGQVISIRDTEMEDYPRPTLQMALKWVIDKYNVHISPYCCSLGWYFDIFDLNQKDVTGCKHMFGKYIPSRGECYKTKEAAAEAGLMYYLSKVR